VTEAVITKTVAEKIKGIEGLHTISALTHRQIVALLERKVIGAELFDEEQIVEVFDPESPSGATVYVATRRLLPGAKARRVRLLERTRAELNKIRRIKTPGERKDARSTRRPGAGAFQDGQIRPLGCDRRTAVLEL
jgi:hypothetical protein